MKESHADREDAAIEALPLLFDAQLTPHRSLSAKGFIILMAVVCTVSFAAGIGFLIAGAWPVVGFLGIDVLLIYWAFRINYRHARLREVLTLTKDELKVTRFSHWGEAESWSFQPYWLQVLMDDPPESDSRLTLRSHGRDLVVGNFLNAAERLEVAIALRNALTEARNGI